MFADAINLGNQRERAPGPRRGRAAVVVCYRAGTQTNLDRMPAQIALLPIALNVLPIRFSYSEILAL